ncbi:MAG: bifunctional aspartate kinase/homoserine dehydrogenase I [Bacteroidales bacterium]|nr:bifunctional aspartate kinase/homoserine dehydrogenase I [Bacteroidales bacterium]
MIVLKFGGSSVGSVSALNNLKSIVEKEKQPCIVVVSAITGITNLLTQMFDTAVENGGDYNDNINIIREKHLALAKSVLSKSEYPPFMEEFNNDLDHLEHLLSSISVMHKNLPALKDHILSMGEQFTSKMIVRMFDNAVRIDGRDLIVTEKEGEQTKILWDKTCSEVTAAFKDFKGLAIVPGFCGRTEDGYITTLGKGGSDLSAAMIAAALNAKSVDIWTDVNGMMTSDPNIVPEAITIPKLSYSEAAELCHYGAKVLFTPAIWPAIKSGIQIRILNTFNSTHPGTIIDAHGEDNPRLPVKGITYVDGVSLITVFGNGLMGQVGTSYRLFGALADKGINLIFISQASSEYSISFAVKSEDGAKALSVIKSGLKADSVHGSYIETSIEEDMAIIAVVGNNMRQTPGISGKIFNTLGRNKINVVATAQGGSELNVSAVVKEEDVRKALQVLHEQFYGSPSKEVDLYVIGHGLVGNELLLQLKKQKSTLAKKHGLKINLKGLADSKTAILTDSDLLGSYPQSWKSGVPCRNFREAMDQMIDAPSPLKIFVDCTASEEVASYYEEVLSNGINVVTANKIAAAESSARYKKLLKLAKENRVSFLNETNVGAGLPVLSTIDELVTTGDKLIGFEASCSGSINFILNKTMDGISLYDAVLMAKEAGFTEPDLRIDLSGKDVKRKLLVLARKAGYTIEEDEIEASPIIPAELFEKPSLEEFMEALKEYSPTFDKMVQEVKQRGNRLRFFAVFNSQENKSTISLVEVVPDYHSYNLDDSTNIFLLYTKRYSPSPLIIKGYGAGAGVTAAGVFGDIIKATQE